MKRFFFFASKLARGPTQAIYTAQQCCGVQMIQLFFYCSWLDDLTNDITMTSHRPCPISDFSRHQLLPQLLPTPDLFWWYLLHGHNFDHIQDLSKLPLNISAKFKLTLHRSRYHREFFRVHPIDSTFSDTGWSLGRVRLIQLASFSGPLVASNTAQADASSSWSSTSKRLQVESVGRLNGYLLVAWQRLTLQRHCSRLVAYVQSFTGFYYSITLVKSHLPTAHNHWQHNPDRMIALALCLSRPTLSPSAPTQTKFFHLSTPQQAHKTYSRPSLPRNTPSNGRLASNEPRKITYLIIS